jgi:TonB family protein
MRQGEKAGERVMFLRGMRIAALAALLAGAGSAIAQPAARVITAADCTAMPKAVDMGRFYPVRAQRLGLDGHANIRCVVTAEGLTQDCVVLDEGPAGAGFGDAALRLSTLFRMRPMTRDGVAFAGAHVTIPIRFVVPPYQGPFAKWFARPKPSPAPDTAH